MTATEMQTGIICIRIREVGRKDTCFQRVLKAGTRKFFSDTAVTRVVAILVGKFVKCRLYDTFARVSFALNVERKEVDKKRRTALI